MAGGVAGVAPRARGSGGNGGNSGSAASGATKGASREMDDDDDVSSAAPPKGGNILSIAFRKALRNSVRMAEKVIEYGFESFHLVMKVLGPCLMCLAISLISFVTYTFFVHALPHVGGGFAVQGGVTAVGTFLLFNALYNYGKAAFTDPGRPPAFAEFCAAQEAARAEAVAAGIADSTSSSTPKPRQCKRCDRLKPPRCHHCSICRRCVLKMDHHCPWINNCVGYKNYRNFCLFMLFLAMSCLFIVLLFSYTFYSHERFLDQFLMRRRRSKLAGVSYSARQSIMTSFMICCSILIALSVLGGFHVYLVITNQTTIEFQTNLMQRKEARRTGEYFRNPYDLGRSRNFRSVFGPNPFCRLVWLLSWFAPSAEGNGLQFPSLSRSKV